MPHALQTNREELIISKIRKGKARLHQGAPPRLAMNLGKIFLTSLGHIFHLRKSVYLKVACVQVTTIFCVSPGKSQAVVIASVPEKKER